MNYQASIKKTYTIDIDAFAHGVGAIALLESGAQYDINEATGISYSYDSQLDYYTYLSKVHSPNDEVVMLLVKTPDNLTLCCNTKVDFVISQCNVGSVLGAYSYNSETGYYYDIGDGVNLYNYPLYNPNAFEAFSYGLYDVTLGGDYSVYDFSSLEYAHLNGFRYDNLTLPSHNISFYRNYLSYYDLNSNYDLTISYGSPLYDYYDSRYNSGFDDGYFIGYNTGYDNGFDNGIKSHTDQFTYNAFGYVSQAFNAVGGILSIEVLPHVTLGLCFSIPLVLVLIMTIFKLVRK